MSTRQSRFAIAAVLVCLATLALAEAKIALPTRAMKGLLDFDFRPERNFTFTVADDAARAYRLTQRLLLEMDYEPAAGAVERGDMLGPFVSPARYGQGRLAEAATVRLTPTDAGVEITARGLFVVPDNQYLLDQSDRRPSKGIRNFKQLYQAKRELTERTGELDVAAVLATLRENLLAGRELRATHRLARLAVHATRPTSDAGLRARELLHAVDIELERRKRLADTAAAQGEKIAAAIAAGDWASAHRLADQTISLLLADQVAPGDPLLTAVERQREESRRHLRAAGALVVSDVEIAPAENGNVAVGFTVLNVGTSPIGSIRVTIQPTDAAGNPSPFRADEGAVYAIDMDPPLTTNEYLPVSVVVAFARASDVARAQIKVVGVARGHQKGR